MREKAATTILIYSFVSLLFLSFVSCSVKGDRNEKVKNFCFNPKYEPVIDSLLAQMTLEEKVGMLHGTGMFVSGGVERLGIPEFYYTDGPNGIREELERYSWEPLKLGNDSSTFFPTGSALAATWNTKLAQQYGSAIGREARARNKDMILGPAVNIMRTPISGRNFEYFSEDPYLSSQITVGYVQGVQDQDVAVCVKHYTANNQEYERNSISVEVSERALREIYLPSYRAAVRDADAMGIMGAYNRFRGEYLCENSYLNNKILKSEFGFKGIVVSDWAATHNTVKAAMGGLDVEMGTPTPDRDYNKNYMGYPLRDSVLAGIVPMEIIDDKVRRILRVELNCKKMETGRKQGELVSVRNKKTAYDVASEAIVLLKNENHLLPLKQSEIKNLAVIGFNADRTQAKGGYTAGVKPKYEITPLVGLKNKLGNAVKINYALGYRQKFEEKDNWRTPPVNIPDKQLIAEAVDAAKKSDVAIIFAGDTREIETESKDRFSLELPFGQDELIKTVVAANHRTIVVVVAGAATNLNVAKQAVPALLYSWFNGSEAGNAIADVLFGDVNPSGKLPFTIPVKLNDVGAHALNAYPGENGKVEYKEGILVGYRWFDTKNIEPAYPFGYGLSYAPFEYTSLETDQTTYHPDDTVTVTVKIENTGNVDGKEVVQCYVHDDGASVMRPVKELKAFKKILVKAGDEQTIKLSFKVNDLAYFDEDSAKWKIDPGTFTIMVGSSSRDIRQQTKIEVVS